MRNKKLSSIVAIFAAAAAVFSAANFARAADSDLFISEAMYDPEGTDAGNEWIEVYNPGDSNISIPKNSLGLIDEPETRDSSGKLRNTCHTFDGALDINSREFVVIADNKANFQSTRLDHDGKILDSVIDLLNSGDTIKLSFDRCNTWKTEFTFSDSWGANGNKKTLEKSYLLGDNTKENWQESCKDGGTPGEEPEICEIESDSASEGDEISDPAVEDSIEASTEASMNNDDKTDAPKKTYSRNLKLSELLPNPSAGEDIGEFTEIYNADSQEIIELSGWKIEDKTGNSYPLPNISLQPGEYRAFYRNSSKFSLNNTGSEEIFLKNPNGEIVDQVSYSGSVKEDYAYAFANSAFLWTSTPTPGEKNVITAPETAEKNTTETNNPSEATENYTSSENIFLNEILPNPKDGSDSEYIEIVNGGVEPVDLFGWRLKDASKSKGYQFKEHVIINPSEYLAIYRSDSKIALNNSDESIYLYDPKNEIASSVSFEKSIKNSSYNFDGKTWKWSNYLTPMKKNKFDSEPVVKIAKPKHAYKDLFTEFSASTKDKETKKLKYSWDFGDGKKSALAKTTHKYLDTGKYTVILSVSDDSQTIEKSFVVNVKNSPRPNIEITKIVPNPVGSDAEAETIDLKNNSNKKIDLAGWKIATGSGEKIYNHPISGEISIEPNETKIITREFSKFSLNNKAGKVQLVMPDGKVIDEIEYAKEKIAENEAYAKIDGEWKWLSLNTQDENINPDENTEIIDDPTGTLDDADNGNGEVLGAADENISVSSGYDSGFTSEDAYIFLSDIGFLKSPNKEINYCPLKNTTGSLEYFLISSI